MAEDFAKCATNVRLDGKVALVTGATAGTGLEVAKNLAKRGARVIIASRNSEKLAYAKAQIIQSSGNNDVITGQMDFQSLATVRNFAYETLNTQSRLDILINNVGAIGLQDRLTEDGLQLMMQVNYFSTFLLTYLLFPLLKKSSPSRIINVSSLTLLVGTIDLEHLNDVGRYSNIGYYANAKLADVLFTVEMEKRIRGTGVSVFSMDPGLINSDFFRNYDNGIIKTVFGQFLLTFGRPQKNVAMMPVYLAVDPKFEGLSGRHFRDCEEFYSSWFSDYTDLTYKLWEQSKSFVNVSETEDWEKLKTNNIII